VNNEDRARVDQLMEFASLHVNRWLSPLAFQLYFGPKFFGQQTDPRVVEEASTNLHGNLAKLESYLLGRNYLAGPTPTLADAVLLPFMSFHAAAQVSLASYPSIAAWTQRMTARPAWKKVAAELEKGLGRPS
jgi:glutathione S-transferase